MFVWNVANMHRSMSVLPISETKFTKRWIVQLLTQAEKRELGIDYTDFIQLVNNDTG